MRTLLFLAVGLLAAASVQAAEPLDKTLDRAFPGTLVVRAPIKLVVDGQQLVVAGSTLQILKDGRFKMDNCFIARLGTSDESSQVLSSVRSGRATFKTERAIKSVGDLKGNRIVSAELADGSVLQLETK
jgi:hypothetical protein